ncbi:hypothetical protein [Ferrimicrobium acidiphilum]|uniref:hypothetical protein n=1 Tax=Ferrimicrobium acidiphilum TaxID=121039 RepID=UPI0023F02D74|nr:hypothetical protein [Ferrimicrobium acidiphilum]
MTDVLSDPLAIIELTNLKAAGKLEELAKHPALTMKPEWIGELARNQDWRVRSSLARNPATANYPDIIKQLAADRDPYVRSALAANPAIAEFLEIAAKLATDEQWYVRRSLASNPAIPSSTASTNRWQTQPSVQNAVSL